MRDEGAPVLSVASLFRWVRAIGGELNSSERAVNLLCVLTGEDVCLGGVIVGCRPVVCHVA